MNVQNKVMVVTGAGNGIGREIVLALLARGASVAAVDISEGAIQETLRLAGDKTGRLSTSLLQTQPSACGKLYFQADEVPFAWLKL